MDAYLRPAMSILNELVARAAAQRGINPTDQIDTIVNRDYVRVELSDTVADLVSKLSKTEAESVVVTDEGKYAGVIDRQKLANTFEELLK